MKEKQSLVKTDAPRSHDDHLNFICPHSVTRKRVVHFFALFAVLSVVAVATLPALTLTASLGISTIGAGLGAAIMR